MTIEKSVEKAPGYIRDLELAIDPATHKTHEDYMYLVQNELDLYEEGEESSIKTAKQAAKVQDWYHRNV